MKEASIDIFDGRGSKLAPQTHPSIKSVNYWNSFSKTPSEQKKKKAGTTVSVPSVYSFAFYEK